MVTPLEEDFMHMAIAEASKCQPENRATPLVGALAVRGAEILATAYRGERKKGEHAEFTLLERKLTGQELRDVVVYTTLEPCVERGHLKTPCAFWLVMRQVQKVYVGMLDPNRDILGLGYRTLRAYGVDVDMFSPAFQQLIEAQNETFAREIERSSTTLRFARPAALKVPGPTPINSLRTWLARPLAAGTSSGSFKYPITGEVAGLDRPEALHVYVYTNRRYEGGTFPIDTDGHFSGHVILNEQSTSYAIYFQVIRGKETLYRTIAMVR